MVNHIKPGTDNQPAGIYRETGVNGEILKRGRTVQIDYGDRLPPTSKPNHGWKK